MSLQERVARALYEHQRGNGWDDAIDTVRDVYLGLATAALSATAEWLELVARTGSVARSLGAVRALHGVGQVIRRALGQEAQEAPEAPREADESPAQRDLREVLEGYGA